MSHEPTDEERELGIIPLGKYDALLQQLSELRAEHDGLVALWEDTDATLERTLYWGAGGIRQTRAEKVIDHQRLAALRAIDDGDLAISRVDGRWKISKWIEGDPPCTVYGVGQTLVEALTDFRNSRWTR